MALSSLCPDPRAMQQLLLGHVAAAEAQPLREHVLHCDHCAQTLHSLKAEETLVEALRAGGAAGDDPDSGVIQDLIHRLEGLRSSLASAPDSAAVAPTARSAGEATLPFQPTAVATMAPEGVISQVAPPCASSSEEATKEVYDFLAPPQTPGELGRLGPYRVLKVLGAGGMGVVFQAEDTQLERMVALKAMLPTLASSPSARQRFLREAKATAAIEHDHIVPIFQVGEDRGVPYLAMPLLKGEPLDERLKRENKLPAATVLRIGREVAEGLAAAHERGLIHRDVKPGNIWLEGKRARVKILDFGLARVVADTTHLTQSGAIVGTPAYMAPEQTRGGTVDHRADLFSLGCVLYRLATGELPFKGADTMSILASLALDNPPPPRELDANIPSALSDLVMQLLAKKPEDRPSSAQAVVEAIQAIEQEQAEGTDARKAMISARPAVWPSPGDQAVRRVEPGKATPIESTAPARWRRIWPSCKSRGKTMPDESTAPAPSGRSRARPSGRRWLASAVVVALGVLGVGYLFAPVIYRVATNRGQLVIEVDDPGVEVVLGQQGVTVHDTATDRKYTIQPGRQDLPAGNYEVEVTEAAGGIHFSTQEFTITRNGQAAVKVTLDRSVTAKPAPADAARPTPIDGPPPPLMEKVGAAQPFAGHTEAVNGVAFSGDGRRAVSSSRDGTVRLWDVDTGKEARQFESGPAVSVAFSPDGRRVLAGTLDLHNFRGAVLWDAESGKEVQRFPMGRSWPGSVALSADGRRALMTGLWSTFVLWDAETGKQVRSLDSTGPMVTSVALSPDGRRALSGSEHETFIRLWDVEKGTVERVFKGHEAAIKSVAFSPDGRRALSGSEDGTLRLWDVSNGQELHQYKGHTDFVNSVAFTADGSRALSGGSDGTVRLWDVSTGKELHCFTGHAGAVLSVAVAPDGRRALSGGEDKSIRLWELPPAGPAGQVRQFDGNTEPIWMVGFGPDGRQVLSVSRDTVRQWDAETGKSAGPPWELAKYPTLAVVSPEGRHVVFIYGLQSIYLWDMEPRKVLSELFARGASLTAVAYSGDGKRLIGGNHPLDTVPAAVQVWDLSTGKQVRALAGHKESVRAVALSQDGRLALSSGPDGVRLWDVEKGEARRSLDRPAVGALAFSPDGRRALLGDGSGVVVLWDLETGKEAASFAGHKGPVNSVAFSPDGLHALSGGDDQTVRVWDVTTGKELACFLGHTARVNSVTFSPNGRHALSGSDDKTVRMWGPFY